MALKTITTLLFIFIFFKGFAQIDSNEIFLASKGLWEYPMGNKYESAKSVCPSPTNYHCTFYSDKPEAVRALMSGTVVANLEIDSTYLIIINWGDYFVAYSNLQKNSLKKGSHILKGQFIGLSNKNIYVGNKYYVDIFLSNHIGLIDLSNFEWFKKECEN